MSTIETVLQRLRAHQGETFHTVTGRPFSYLMQGDAIALQNTNRIIPRSDIERALALRPRKVADLTKLGVQGPSYVFALLKDTRIVSSQERPNVMIGQKYSDPPITKRMRAGNTRSVYQRAGDFEEMARRRMEALFGKRLHPGNVADIPKRFDFVSADGTVVGDAKYYSMVRGHGIPPAKHATISEYVWLLEKVSASHKFLCSATTREYPRRGSKNTAACCEG